MNDMDWFYNNKRKAEIISFYSILVGIAFMMFLFNRHTPMIADDYAVAICEHNSIMDCLKALPDFYMHWGGGLFCQFTSWFFMLYNPLIFDIFNSLFFSFMLYVLYLHVVGSFKVISPFIISVLSFSLFIFPPSFGQDFLWLTAACSYMWCITINLLYLLPLRFQLCCDKSIVSNPIVAIIYGILGIPLGLTIANMSIAIVMLFAFTIVWQLYKKQKPFFWEYCCFIGTCFAFVFVMLSPGAQVRIARSSNVYETFNIMKNIYYAFLDVFNWAIFLPLILVPTVLIFLRRVKLDIHILFYFWGFLITHFSMIAVPVELYSGRVKVIPIYFLCIFLGYILYKMKPSKKVYTLKLVISVTLLISIVQCMFMSSHDIKLYEISYNNFEKQVNAQKKNGNHDIVVDKLYIPQSKYNAQFGLENITDDPQFWVNICAAQYYNVASIRTKCE